MLQTVADTWMPFRPGFKEKRKAASLLREFARALAASIEAGVDERQIMLDEAQRGALGKRAKCDRRDQKTLIAAVKVLSDLFKLGWGIRVANARVEVCRPRETAGLNGDAREYLRRQQHGQRNDQLREPAVREFVKGLEVRRPLGGPLVSIFSLMRDGRKLAELLREVRTIGNVAESGRAVGDVVQPYLQFVRGEERCELTGLRLVDIWRYFRHTWASSYKSVPGRTMTMLVRDAAAPFHPVIGIAALSSAAVAVTVRDEWIGWTPAAIVQEMTERPSALHARWLVRIVEEGINEIYKVDLLKDELLTPGGLKRPTQELIEALFAHAKVEREKHHRLMQQRQYKKPIPPGADEEFWLEQAKTHLFRSKRAEELARLLSVREVLTRYFASGASRQAVQELAASGEGRTAIAKVLRRAKADRVGIAVADLTVCGARPPYNELLGGKLVAMLATSPEVIVEYRRRYGGTSSVIASSMAGRAVQRPAELAFIGTTSLYGQRPSQYDRINVPCSCAGGPSNDAVRYVYLGRTRGLGTFQFGDATVAAMQEMLRQSKNGLQVNSVFGEGVNPRLRKIRDALGELGLPQDELLEHGTPRLVYGVELAHNTREYLLGRAKRLQYLMPQRSPSEVTSAIARWWVERWVVNRVQREDIVERVSRHTLVHPIRHGAKVELPMTDSDQPRLFGGAE